MGEGSVKELALKVSKVSIAGMLLLSYQIRFCQMSSLAHIGA